MAHSETTVDGYKRALELIEQEKEQKTCSLDLGNLGLKTIPPELFELEHLAHLSLGDGYLNEKNEYQSTANSLSENLILRF